MLVQKGKDPALSIDTPLNNAMITQGGKVFKLLLRDSSPDAVSQYQNTQNKNIKLTVVQCFIPLHHSL